MLISNSCENMMYTKFPSFFVFPTSLIQILSFLFDSTYTVLHYGSSFAHAQTANPNFKLKKKTRISSKYKSCAVFAILFCNKPQGSMKSWQIKNHSNVAGWPWLFGLVVRRQPGHLILNSNKYPHSLVPFTSSSFEEGQDWLFCLFLARKTKNSKACNFCPAILMARNATKMALPLKWHVLTL